MKSYENHILLKKIFKHNISLKIFEIIFWKKKPIRNILFEIVKHNVSLKILFMLSNTEIINIFNGTLCLTILS